MISVWEIWDFYSLSMVLCAFSSQVWSVCLRRSTWSPLYPNIWPHSTTTVHPAVTTHMWSTSAQQNMLSTEDLATHLAPVHPDPTIVISRSIITMTTSMENYKGNTSADTASNVCKGTLYSLYHSYSPPSRSDNFRWILWHHTSHVTNLAVSILNIHKMFNCVLQENTLDFVLCRNDTWHNTGINVHHRLRHAYILNGIHPFAIQFKNTNTTFFVWGKKNYPYKMYLRPCHKIKFIYEYFSIILLQVTV